MKRMFAVLTIASLSLIAAPPAEKGVKKEVPAKVEETKAAGAEVKKTTGHHKGKKVEKKEEPNKTEVKK